MGKMRHQIAPSQYEDKEQKNIIGKNIFWVWDWIRDKANFFHLLQEICPISF
jgi:hypothetical protein